MDRGRLLQVCGHGPSGLSTQDVLGRVGIKLRAVRDLFDLADPGDDPIMETRTP